ncbi:hypothetical protein NDU88_001574 [Pleurodeles waltl]|uniref:Uncharacterized protein n=1 Tax=Pleurodeles waltl TaxID=8319 RepID=A0AAV7S8E7_PLEWA|nr:hypothetical protein NDU88_001574 [Pleurodeles waltl]
MRKYATARPYGERDRLGATLAALLHPNRETDLILEIQDKGGELLRDPDAITGRFRGYYTALYTSRAASDPVSI